MKTKKFIFPLMLVPFLIACGEKPAPVVDPGKTDDKGSTEPDKPKKDPEDKELDDLVPPLPLPEDYDFKKFEATPEPFGVNMSYYSDIYSRGFSWFTDDTVDETELYIKKSEYNYQADWTSADKYTGTTLTVEYKNDGKGFSADDTSYESKSSYGGSTLKVKNHKVHIEGLKPHTNYSYKIGSPTGGYKYGAFTTERTTPKGITAIQLSDAQTYNTDFLTTWRNTLDLGVKQAGKDLDFILYNGDQFDKNMEKVGGNTVNNILRYTKALDAVEDIKNTIPYMTSAGNHEPDCPYSQVLGSDVKYGAYDYKGGNYSYDYGFAHFIVLNANRLADDDTTDEDYVAQMKFLTDDLASESAKSAKWKVVMMHIGAYTTGDHSNDEENQRLVERLTPLFSANHIDLVLQAHDHTYNKTLPYKWDAAGYTTTYKNSDVVNYSPETTEIDGKKYDLNPQGTYYVTTGAAGHRAGSGGKDGKHEYEDGIFSEVKVNASGELEAAESTKTYLNNKYKIEAGKLTVNSSSASYTTSKGVSVNGERKAGDPATACADGQMFGVLNITEETLTYDSYLIKTGTKTTTLFDTLNICKK